MVGIVIVSHSQQLAQGVRELAMQMVQGDVAIAVAAGVTDVENPLGTDAIAIQQAIESVYNDDGVVVLMDLGSAILSAEMALEFLSEAQRENVQLCAAPLVEGAIAACVAAASGCNITQVIAEANQSLAAKAAQLNVVSSPSSFVLSNEQRTSNQQKTISLTIRNRFGLHARPAAKFVTTGSKFNAQIHIRNVTKNTEFVRADSINQVTTLGVRQGDIIAIAAGGDDADKALVALQALVESNFGEDDVATKLKSPKPTPLQTDNEFTATPAVSGIAIAPLFQYRPSVVQIPQLQVEDTATQWQRLQAAIQTATQEIETLQSQLALSNNEAAIFDAHLLCLQDPAILDPLHERIFALHQNAEFAWNSVINQLADSYRNLEDTYLQARAHDVIDVGQRVLRSLVGSTANFTLDLPSILVATDLIPSFTAQLDPAKVLGICTTLGSATSHTAILARTLGIPAVVGVASDILRLTNGTLLALDGEIGKVWVQPDVDTVAALKAKRDRQINLQQQAQAQAQTPAITRDGKHVDVVANISSVADAQRALKYGAAGVGLLRTEFLYFDRNSLPTEGEQLAVICAIAQIMENRPLIIRTLDIGGDKPLPYLQLPYESNPFLGLRGIRFCLAHQDIFKTQLRAILRATPGHQIKLMLPMVATVAEVETAKDILAQVQAELNQQNLPFDANMEIGIMVEIPSAVLIADKLAPLVDFFSIGTNDLSQYIMACDRVAARERNRTNPNVATLADALHPAVLRAIHQTVQAAHNAGIEVSVCGELAANADATPILLGLGVDKLSVNPQAIPVIKQKIRQLSLKDTIAIAQAALEY